MVNFVFESNDEKKGRLSTDANRVHHRHHIGENEQRDDKSQEEIGEKEIEHENIRGYKHLALLPIRNLQHSNEHLH